MPKPLNIALRDANVPLATGQSLFQAAKQLDVDAFEFLVTPEGALPAARLEDGTAPFSLQNEAELSRFRQRLADEGIRVSALLLGTDFSGDAAEAHVDWAIAMAHAAGRLGAPAIRIDTATSRRELPAEQVRDNFIRRIGRVLKDTASTGVDLGIENHGYLSNDPAFLDPIFDAVADPRLGMTLDTGNFYWFGHPLDELYGLLERYAPRTKHTHIKNINYPPDLANTRRSAGYEYATCRSGLADGNIDLRRIVAILLGAGYRRDLCIENEALSKYPPEQRAEVLRRDVEALRDAQIG